MQFSKEDIGKTLYMIEPVKIDGQSFNIIYAGILVGIIPKYQFLDAYNAEYKREQNYLFRVMGLFDQISTKTTTAPEMIFEKLGEAIGKSGTNSLFHYSVILKREKEAQNRQAHKE